MPKDRGVLVGRTAEIAALDPFAGSQALLLLRGSAGIGKTAVLRELGRMWRDRGITVLAVPVGDVEALAEGLAQAVAAPKTPEAQSERRAHAAEFTWRRCAEKTVEAYRRSRA